MHVNKFSWYRFLSWCLVICILQPASGRYQASFQEHLLKRHCGHYVKSIPIPLLLLRSTGAQIILIEKTKDKMYWAARQLHATQASFWREKKRRKVIFINRRRADAHKLKTGLAAYELAAVVSFGRMKMLVLTLSWKIRFFVIADDLSVLSYSPVLSYSQVLSKWNYVSVFPKKAITGL